MPFIGAPKRFLEHLFRFLSSFSNPFFMRDCFALLVDGRYTSRNMIVTKNICLLRFLKRKNIGGNYLFNVLDDVVHQLVSSSAEEHFIEMPVATHPKLSLESKGYRYGLSVCVFYIFLLRNVT